MLNLVQMDGKRWELVHHGEGMDLGLNETVHSLFGRIAGDGVVVVVVAVLQYWLYAVQQFPHFRVHAFYYDWQLDNRMH